MDFPQVNFHVRRSRKLSPSEGFRNKVTITIETKSYEVLENPITGHRILTGRSTPFYPTVFININLRSSSPVDILLQLLGDQPISRLLLMVDLASKISTAAIELGFGRNGFVMDIFYKVAYHNVVDMSDTPPLRLVLSGRVRYREETKSLKMETEPCSICLDNLVSGGSDSKHGAPIRITCSHDFHDRCLLEWLERENTCPLCRTVLYDRSMILINGD